MRPPLYGLEAGRRRRRRRRLPALRLPPLAAVALVLVAVIAAGSAFVAYRLWPLTDRSAGVIGPPVPKGHHTHGASPQAALPLRPLSAPSESRVHIPGVRVSAGILVDSASGSVLWGHEVHRKLPIASLTKLMTALLVVEHTTPKEPVLITPDAIHYTGSGVGLLPEGKHVSVKALLYGLLLPSGNDAAIALADHVAHTQKRFVAMMNDKARSLGLRCTHFASPHGLEPGNRSCPADLAALARIDLHHSRIATVVRSAHAIVRFPIKGGKLYLNNTNPLLRMGYPGTIGLKTGDTDDAGHCLIAVVRHGPLTIAVVLLHSPNTQQQARVLLNKAFRVDRG